MFGRSLSMTFGSSSQNSTRLYLCLRLMKRLRAMLPSYCRRCLCRRTKNFLQIRRFYVFFGFYLYWRRMKGTWSRADTMAVAVAGYGLMLYATAFRNLWSNNFEMALQPQKIVYFYIV